MKRTPVFALAALMLLLTACGGNSANAPAADKTDSDKTVEQTISPGTINGQTYTNEYFNITCALDEDWTILSDEEIAEVLGTASDMLDDEKYVEILEGDGAAITELFATAADGLYSINTNVSKVGILAGAVLDESSYIDAAIEGENNIVEALTGMGMENVHAEKVAITVAGRETYAGRVSAEYQGIAFYETIAVLKEGRYFFCITTSSAVEDVCQTMLDYFAPIA